MKLTFFIVLLCFASSLTLAAARPVHLAVPEQISNLLPHDSVRPEETCRPLTRMFYRCFCYFIYETGVTFQNAVIPSEVLEEVKRSCLLQYRTVRRLELGCENLCGCTDVLGSNKKKTIAAMTEINSECLVD